MAATFTPSAPVPAHDRFGLEYEGRDFPFYDGRPLRISGPQWWFLMAAVVLGYGALVAPLPIFRGGLGQFVPAILFPAIPLAALAFVVGGHWTALFKPVRGRDVMWMVAFGLLNSVVTIAAAALALRLLGVSSNRAIAGLSELSGSERTLFFLKTLPQLLGEEIVTILPFLALMYFLVSHQGFGRRAAMVLAWLATALWFGALHLPTYDWNLGQSLLLIGLARLILTLPYIKTKNIWVSAGAHIVNDWSFFGLTLALNALQGSA